MRQGCDAYCIIACKLPHTVPIGGPIGDRPESRQGSRAVRPGTGIPTDVGNGDRTDIVDTTL